MKKALGNDKLANKRQHLGENKTISKWQGVFQVEPRCTGRSTRAHRRVSTGKGQVQSPGREGQQSPVWLEQRKGVRGAGGRPERFPEKHNVNRGLPNPGWDRDINSQWENSRDGSWAVKASAGCSYEEELECVWKSNANQATNNWEDERKAVKRPQQQAKGEMDTGSPQQQGGEVVEFRDPFGRFCW